MTKYHFTSRDETLSDAVYAWRWNESGRSCLQLWAVSPTPQI